MVDYCEILRYQSFGYCQRQIEQTVQISHHTIEDTLKAAHEKGITWPLDEDITNAELQEILFPGKYVYASPYTMPDFAQVHQDLCKEGRDADAAVA